MSFAVESATTSSPSPLFGSGLFWSASTETGNVFYFSVVWFDTSFTALLYQGLFNGVDVLFIVRYKAKMIGEAEVFMLEAEYQCSKKLNVRREKI